MSPVTRESRSPLPALAPATAPAADRRRPGQSRAGRRISPSIARWPLTADEALDRPARLDAWVSLVRESIAHYRAGLADRASRYWADGIVWSVATGLPDPGCWVGAEQVFAYHRLLARLTDGTFGQRLVSLEGSGGPIVEAHLRTTAIRGDARIDVPTLAVFEISRGSIARVTEIPGDREAWLRFWAG